MPTSLLLGVVQAACLGAQDSVTPLISIVYSTLVNIVGDYLLVNRLRMGLRGAAIATTLAQVSFEMPYPQQIMRYSTFANFALLTVFSGRLLQHCWVLPGGALSEIDLWDYGKSRNRNLVTFLQERSSALQHLF